MEKLEFKTPTQGKLLKKSLALWAGMLIAASPAWAAGKITISGNGQLLLNYGGSITLGGVLSLSTSQDKSALLVAGTTLEAESGKLVGLGPLNVGSNPTYNLALAEDQYPPVIVADNTGGTSDTTTDTDTDTTTDTDTDTTTDTDTDTTTDTDTDTTTDTDTDTGVDAGTEITEGEEVSLGGGATVVVSGGKATISVGDSEIQLDVPTGAKVEVAAGGAVVAKLELAGGEKAEQTANQDGSKVSSFTTADGKTTKITSLPGSVTKFNADGSSESEATVGSVAQKMKINTDGSMDAELTVGGVSTKAAVPAGTEATPTASGAVMLSSPVTVDGNSVAVATNLNKSGEIVLEIPKIGNSKPVVLPKTPPGADVSIIGTKIRITTPLAVSNTTGRSSSATASGNFVGRTDGSEVLVYPDDNATFSFEKDLADAAGLTSLSLASGTANIDYGNMSGSMSTKPYMVSNDAIELSLSAKSNYVSLPAQVSLSDADLEIEFENVHSVWVYNNSDSSWAAYSADAANTSALTAAKIDKLSDNVNAGSGMFVYSAAALDIAIGDGRDLSIESLLKASAAPATGWHLLAVGNQGDTVGEIAALSSNIETIWVASDSSWNVYSSDMDTQKLIEEKGYTLIESTSIMPSTSAIWVHVVDSSSSQSSRVATPPSN